MFAAKRPEAFLQLCQHSVGAGQDLGPPVGHALLERPHLRAMPDLFRTTDAHDFNALAPLKFSDAREDMVNRYV